MQMVGHAVSSGPSRLKAGKLQSISLHRQPCFADFPAHCIQLSSHFPAPRNSSDHQFHSPKQTHEYLLIPKNVSLALPKDQPLLFRTGAFHQNFKPDCTIWQHIHVCLCHFILICNLKTRPALLQLYLFHNWNNSQHMPFSWAKDLCFSKALAWTSTQIHLFIQK